MKSILAAATILSALAIATAPARADLILVVAPGPGVDVNHVIVNQPTVFDVIGEGSVTGERVLSAGGGSVNIFPSNFINSSAIFASTPTADLTTHPILLTVTFTPTTTGAFQISASDMNFTTNDATYNNLSSDPLAFTVVPALVAAPEPGSLALLGVGFAGAMLMGARVLPRDRREAASYGP
jgi:PEP-CTERM motif